MRFKYADVVEIVDGFYEGQKGIVTNYLVEHYCSYWSWKEVEYTTYRVELEDNCIWVGEEQLKLIKREKEKYGSN